MNSEQLLQKKSKIKEYASFYFPLLDAIKEEQDSISEEDVILDDFIPKLEKIKFEKSEKIFGKKMSMNIQQMWDKVKEMSYKYKTVDSPRVELEIEYKKIYNQKFGNQKEKKESTMSLKNYLQKRLTINSKEAQLIESAVKEYVRRKKIEEGKISNLIGNVAQGVKGLFGSKADKMPIAVNSVRKFTDSFIDFISEVAYMCESKFKDQLKDPSVKHRGLFSPNTSGLRANILTDDLYQECYSFMKSKLVNSVLKYPDSKDFAFKDNPKYEPSDAEIDFRISSVDVDTFSDSKNNPRFRIILTVEIGDSEYDIIIYSTDYDYRYEKTVVSVKKGRDYLHDFEYASDSRSSNRFKYYFEFELKELLSKFLSEKYGQSLANQLLSFRIYKA